MGRGRGRYSYASVLIEILDRHSAGYGIRVVLTTANLFPSSKYQL